MSQSPLRRSVTAAVLLLALLSIWTVPVFAADPPASGSSQPAQGGTSLAEKIACAYLLVGGSVMLYYGPRERENGQLTRDGKSEAIGGAIAIGISFALLHDIVKKHSLPHHP